MKLLTSSSCAGFFFFIIIEVGAQQRRDRWSLGRPFKDITSKLTRAMLLSSSPTNQRREQMKYVNLSEQQGVPPIREYSSQHSIISAALLRDLYKINGNRLLLADSTGIETTRGQLFLDEEEDRKRRRDGPEVKKTRGADSRHSFLITTAIVPDINSSMYSRVPAVSLYETPIFEQDSYLEALQLSRLPCQSLADPGDCNDSTTLFRQQQQSPAIKNNEAPASKKLLATIRVLINFHERYPHLNDFIK